MRGATHSANSFPACATSSKLSRSVILPRGPAFLLRFAAQVAITFCFAIALSAADTKPPLRVAIAGLVHGHADGFFSHSLNRPEIQIVAIAEPDRALFDRYAAKFHLDPSLYHADLEETLRSTKPQAVLVYTSTYDHRRVVELCAHYSVPVMMEKPLAVSYKDAQAIARAARAAKIQVLVNYETSWYPSNHAAYDLVRSGAIGDIRKVVVHDGHQGPKEINVAPEFLKWLTDPKLNGAGALFDFGCYGADLMTWLMDGERPLAVTAVTHQIKPDIYPHVDDEATLILTYPKAQAILQASWNWPFDRKDMEVYGRIGSVFTIARNDLSVRLPHQAQATNRAAAPVPAPYDDSLTYLRAVLLDGAKPDALSSLETNLIVTEILDAARRSASSGKTIRLPQ
jgi:predicted dehydrogenase